MGSDVRVLGVAVGTVDEVTPSGTDVEVTMSYDADVQIPDDASAVIIAPSIVGDRFVQLTPAYDGGPVLADGAELGTDRTSMPLELDQVYSSLNDLNVALGPTGANRQGALSDLLEVTADNFGGQGAAFHQTIEDFGRFSQTLSNNREELFGTAEKLQSFLQTLAENDTTVRQFNRSLARISGMLSGERQELAAALDNLGGALEQVSGFVRENREILGRNIAGPQPGLEGAGQAARLPRRDPARRPAGAEQPRADLQPAGRHARHPRQHRRARRPDRERPGPAAVQHRRAGRQPRQRLRHHQEAPARQAARPAGRLARGTLRGRRPRGRPLRPLARRPRGAAREGSAR